MKYHFDMTDNRSEASQRAAVMWRTQLPRPKFFSYIGPSGELHATAHALNATRRINLMHTSAAKIFLYLCFQTKNAISIQCRQKSSVMKRRWKFRWQCRAPCLIVERQSFSITLESVHNDNGNMLHLFVGPELKSIASLKKCSLRKVFNDSNWEEPI